MVTYLPKYADVAVPRYTSYPPATEFHQGVSAVEQDQWLAAIGEEDTLSLYVHIPFCQVLCWYCGCHTSVPNNMGRVRDYVGLLKQEIKNIAAQVYSAAKVVHVHFGGGTPNILSADALGGILAALKAGFQFADSAEIAIEVDPRNLSADHIAALMGHLMPQGKIRVSIGVQDVSADVQSLINRDQPFEVVASLVGQLRSAGVGGINMDLMYGLPGQTIAHVVASANKCAELMPDRLAVFGYAHLPWFKKNQLAIDEARLPQGQERLDQAEAVREALIGHGYVAIGIDHFAKPDDPLSVAQASGKLRRNFQGYTVDPATVLIGFGASSISSFAQGYIQNEPHLGRYREMILSDGVAPARGVAIAASDRCVGAIIERLMCDFRVELHDLVSAEVDVKAPLAHALPLLDPMAVDGLVDISATCVSILPEGRPYVRNVAACFDPTSGAGQRRFSKAV